MEHSLWNLMHELSEGRENLPAFLYRENEETVSVDYDAFLRELEENGIVYDLQDVMPLEVPDVALPWRE